MPHHVILCEEASAKGPPRNSGCNLYLRQVRLILAESVDGGSLDNGNPAIFRLQHFDASRHSVSNLGLEMPTLPEATDEYDCRDVIARHGYLFSHETNDIFHDRVEDSRCHFFLRNCKAVAP